MCEGGCICGILRYNIEVFLCAAIEACDIKWNTAYLKNEVLIHQPWMLWLCPYTGKSLSVANELVRSLNCYNIIPCSHCKGCSHVSNFVQLTQEFMNSYSRLLHSSWATCKSAIEIEEEIEHLDCSTFYYVDTKAMSLHIEEMQPVSTRLRSVIITSLLVYLVFRPFSNHPVSLVLYHNGDQVHFLDLECLEKQFFNNAVGKQQKPSWHSVFLRQFT